MASTKTKARAPKAPATSSVPTTLTAPQTKTEAAKILDQLGEKLRKLADIDSKARGRLLRLAGLVAKRQSAHEEERASVVAEVEALATLLYPYSKNTQPDADEPQTFDVGGHMLRWGKNPERIEIIDDDMQAFYKEIAEKGTDYEDLFIRKTTEPNKQALKEKANRSKVEELTTIEIAQDQFVEIEPAGAPNKMRTIIGDSPHWEIK